MCGKPKVAVTIRLDQTTVNYFKNLSEEMKMPYQTLISSFLAECAAKKMKPSITWRGGLRFFTSPFSAQKPRPLMKRTGAFYIIMGTPCTAMNRLSSSTRACTSKGVSGVAVSSDQFLISV